MNLRRLFGRQKRPRNEAVIDLGRMNAIEERNKKVETSAATETPVSSTADSANDMGFLGTLASAAGSSTGTEQETSPEINPDKVEHLHRRIDTLLDRLELIERKMERVESRLDIRRY